MKLKMYPALVLALSLLTFPNRAGAGAWILEPGSWELELFSQFFWNTHDYDSPGKRVRKPNNGRFTELREEVKIETSTTSESQGLLSNLNLFFHLPIESAHFKDRNVSQRTTGLEEVRTGLKYLFTSNGLSSLDLFPGLNLSGELIGKFPACNKRSHPPLADCQIDVEMRFLAGRGFLEENGLSRLYGNIEVGYRFRAEKPADEIPYVLEIGVYPWSRGRTRLLLKAALEGVGSRPFGGRGDKEDFTKVIGGMRLELGDILPSPDRPNRGPGRDPTRFERNVPGFEIGYGNVVAGKNTGAGQSIFFKLFYRY